ncbi:MAG: hypothetical protein LBN37_03490 [Bacteroidales bacterium]|nr:hypothetical protein [Bacteroidales bacterium]
MDNSVIPLSFIKFGTQITQMESSIFNYELRMCAVYPFIRSPIYHL